MSSSVRILAAIAVIGSAVCAPKVAAIPIATAKLQSAMVVSATTTFSCRGGGFCRETAFAIEDALGLDDAKDDCTTRKGTVSSDPCPREHMVVACSGPGTTVIAYEQDDAKELAEAVSTLTSVCEMQEGTIERPSAP